MLRKCKHVILPFFTTLVLTGLLLAACSSATGSSSSTGNATVTVTNPWNATITFSGQTATLATGSSMTVTAAVSPAPDSYAWYVDGTVISGATTDSVSFGSTLAAGSHVLTLIVVKGTAEASEQFSFAVGGAGTVSGTVKDAYSGSFISGVAVSVYASGSTTALASATSDSSGAYSISVAPGTGYSVSFVKSGYMTISYNNVSVTSSTTTYLESLLQISTAYSSGTGTATGTVADAFNGSGLSGVAISLYSGVNTTTGTVVATATTGSSGAYTITAAAGAYTAQLSMSSYSTTTFTLYILGGITKSNQNFQIAPATSSGQWRFVLTWGSTPSDLDSHLLTPSSYHVYYSDQGSSTNSPYAALDNDVTTSYGPETITIYTQASGDYTYYVNNYSDMGSSSSSTLASSGAVVKVYQGSSLKTTFPVPSGAGTLWKVFKLNGSTITPINTMFYASSDANVITHGISRGGEAWLSAQERVLFGNLPPKTAGRR